MVNTNWSILMDMATILDILNEDCWRVVLDLLPTADIIRSERVCRSWQHVIFRYLQVVGISIEYPWYGHKVSRNQRIVKMEEDDPEKFKILTRKWGSCIKKTDCVNEDSLTIIRKNCPDLEDVTFYGLQEDALLSGSTKSFKRLKRVHFRGCDSLTDACVKHWLVTYNIEELIVWGAEDLTGKCLLTPHSSKLKGLCFKECEALDYRHLLSATKHLTDLKKLVLVYVPQPIFQHVHLLLDKLSRLEDLCLRWEKRMELEDDWAESIGRLRLRYLDVSFNPNVTDEWLEKASCGFERLKELNLEGCLGISGLGAKAACSVAGPSLQGLHLGSNVKINDASVEDIVRACPNLVWINLSYCHGVTEDIVARLGKARSVCDRKMRLILQDSAVEGLEKDKYPWLILDFGD
ncbi:F-box/LRR-repeat protein 7-like isoform X3 [Leguminivora glycinivorella]|uniref:F-box/LRR-repeat protein 7-like isoform X3 n=1 Tax=Leguminivora glycinivorella TaxID=1035111 RepID=UPI00200E4C23|nr:F-box/LRR-repeat protein 7-like isoform X3 [Leguminivora glycinivorella]